MRRSHSISIHDSCTNIVPAHHLFSIVITPLQSTENVFCFTIETGDTFHYQIVFSDFGPPLVPSTSHISCCAPQAPLKTLIPDPLVLLKPSTSTAGGCAFWRIYFSVSPTKQSVSLHIFFPGKSNSVMTAHFQKRSIGWYDPNAFDPQKRAEFESWIMVT
jgi:hypothetical protein